MNLQETIERLFPGGGFYIEAGAHDGVGDSTTYALEKSGKWDGLCVEPSTWFKGLQRSRRCHLYNGCLWTVDDGWIIFREVEGNAVELSGIPSKFQDQHDRIKYGYRDRKCRTCTLPTLLRRINAPYVIQFFCLDTEGSELEILQAHDFDAYKFEFLVVEHNDVDAKRLAIRELLESKGMRYAGGEGVDDWYMLQEKI